MKSDDLSTAESSRRLPRANRDLKLRPWWPPLAWTGAILTATSVPGSWVPKVGIANVDKVVHLGLYGVLGLLVARALDDGSGAVAVRSVLAAAVMCSVLGAADEWHQSFIPGRSTEFADWAADTTGGVIGASTSILLRRRRNASRTI